MAELLTGIVVLLAGGVLLPSGSNEWSGLWHVTLALGAAGIVSLYRMPKSSTTSSPAWARLYPFVLLSGVVLGIEVAILANPYTRSFMDSWFRSRSLLLTGLWGGTPLPLGTTYWSLPLLATYVIITFLQPTWRRRAFMLLTGVAAVAIYFALLGPLQTYVSVGKPPRSLIDWYSRDQNPLQNMSEPISWSYVARLIGVERPQIILLALLWVAGSSMQRLLSTPPGVAITNAEATGSGFQLPRRKAIAVSCLGAILGVFLTVLTVPVCVSQNELVGRKAALMTSNIQMKVPERGSYGPKSIGMFGRLPGCLRSLGMSLDEIAGPNDLRDHHEILILANLQQNFSPQEKTRIWDWVREGGGLLVLTDHTGDKGLRLPTNDLLAPCGLKANFDTAKLWCTDGSFRYEPLIGSPINAIRGVRSRGALDYGTGASIEAAPPAMPIMQARYAYIDPGTFTAVTKGHLQNLTYDVGERLGDIPLVGFSRLGNGRAILFGDTSPFQNGALSTSLEFVRQVLGMLLPKGPAPDRMPGVAWLIAGGLAAGLIVLVCLFAKAPGTLLCLGVLALTWSTGWSVMRTLPEPVKLQTERTAIVDISTHPYANVQGWADHAVSGLETCLMREGYAPIVNEGPLHSQLALSQAGDVLFLVSPLRRLTGRETQSIDDFLTRGGTVVLNCGYEEAGNINETLSRYGVQVLNVPLGASPTEPVDPDRVHFLNAWQVQGEGQALEQIDGRPVAISTPVGMGTLIVIGDSKFFWDRNIESRETHRPGNIRFLSRLLPKQESKV